MADEAVAGARARRIAGTVFLYLAVTMLLVFLFIVFAAAENVDNVPGSDDLPVVALIAIIWFVITLIVLLVLILIQTSGQSDGSRKAASELEWSVMEHDDADEWDPPKRVERERFVVTRARGTPQSVLDDPTPVPHDLRTIPVDTRAWGPDHPGDVYTFHFPRAVDGALWCNDYIPIDKKGTRLRLRTLLAAPRGASFATTSRRPARPKTRPKQEPYYDYSGDVHDVIDVEGIGPVYAKRLEAIGVKTTARLCYEDPRRIANGLGVPEKTVRSWQANAELMKVKGIGKQYAEALARAGVGGIQELKDRSAQSIADQVNEYLAGLGSNVLGTSITTKRVASWQKAAKSMRRVRLKVPET